MTHEIFTQLRSMIEHGHCEDIAPLQALGYAAQDDSPTEAALQAMKPYKVTRAIFMAAGMGNRAVPFTYDMPKGMIHIHGEAMIERELRQLKEVGIDDIWLVTGYMPEGYTHLGEKFGVRFIQNPNYCSMNNIATVYTARNLLDRNTYLLNIDNYMKDNIFHQYEYRSWYASPYVSGRTGEWCLTLDDDDLITRVDVGGGDCYIMGGPAYLNEDFAKKLSRYTPEYVRDEANSYMYWEHVYINRMDEFPLHANKLEEAAIEFETLDELRKVDASYASDTGNRHLRAISSALGIGQQYIHDVRSLHHGLFTRRFSMAAAGHKYMHLFYDSDVQALFTSGHSSSLIELDVEVSCLLECTSPSKADAAAAMEALRHWHERHKALHDSTIKRSTLLQRASQAYGLPEHYRPVIEAEADALDKAPEQDILRVHGAFSADNCLISEGESLIVEDMFGYKADRLVDVAFYCVSTDGDLNELLYAYLEREPLESEAERCKAYAAASSLALHLRYNALEAAGIDCCGASDYFKQLLALYQN